MKNWKEFIESGILELYVLGETTEAENAEVEEMSARYEEIKQELLEISIVLENLAMETPVIPDPIIRPFLLATIDYSERLKRGEPFSSPPLLSSSSVIADYEPWISRSDMVPEEEAEDIFAKILSYTPQLITAIVWIREMAPQEIHDDQHEKFLILEGTCDIVIGELRYSLKRGDYLTIPLHKPHHVQVTSSIPCKVLLQRVAA